ncbi:hypothetical protein HY945_02455, partial [Candidatus Gottesmanbacteria bacterium]|nr:hypothetical protein [Candidatus Gottesmanbacteria bacterium]
MRDYLFDTNCILRFLLRDNLPQASIIKQYFQNAKDGKVKIHIPILAFVEAVFILTRLYHFQKADVIEKLTTLAELTYIEIEKRSLLISALSIYG